MNASTSELDWAEIHRQEQTITEAATTVQIGIGADTTPIPGSTPPARRKRQMTPYQTTPKGYTRATLINALMSHPMTLGMLTDKLNRNRKTLHGHLTRMVRAGCLQKLNRGFYAISQGSMDEIAKADKFNLSPAGSRVLMVVV